MSYRITLEMPSGALSLRHYMSKGQAMDAWDAATEAALPGDYLELLTSGTEGTSWTLVSSYRPVGRVLK